MTLKNRLSITINKIELLENVDAMKAHFFNGKIR